MDWVIWQAAEKELGVWRSGGTVSEDDRVKFGATDEQVAAILGSDDAAAVAAASAAAAASASAASAIDEQVPSVCSGAGWWGDEASLVQRSCFLVQERDGYARRETELLDELDDKVSQRKARFKKKGFEKINLCSAATLT